MSVGLIALLDDLAAIARVAAAHLDKVASQATKAGAKGSGRRYRRCRGYAGLRDRICCRA